jgi:hypothetical protein
MYSAFFFAHVQLKEEGKECFLSKSCAIILALQTRKDTRGLEIWTCGICGLVLLGDSRMNDIKKEYLYLLIYKRKTKEVPHSWKDSDQFDHADLCP